ncbi:protein MULTIPOLAR SPINDLE 1 [Euphorbia lathyris]|uniref:protein MULTIPOLAR SPINDLE 1 n=1 Tax=Euphorbia lathyris TaxID=212925 RepID=UPI003313CB89
MVAGLSDKAATTKAAPMEDQSLKLAVAISLLRSKLLQRQTSLPNPPQSDALRWKRKAKERKQELLRLREDLKEAEDTSSRCDLFSQSASCKCYFYNNLGKLSPKLDGDCSDRRFDDVLRRRFLRQVRYKERRRKDGPNRRHHFSDLNSEDEVEQLKASVDFLVDLHDTASPVQESNFANWSHQAVDFILASLRNLLPRAKNMDFIEEIVNSLIVRLIRRMCTPSQGVESHIDFDAQFYIQHLIRKLGSDSYIGQRAILAVSQRISAVAENLLFLDPFDDAFPNMHRCLYIMIQLIEYLVCDYLLTWSEDNGFDNVLFEEWVISLLHGRKALELLENRNGIYMLYMDRVMGQLAKQVGQVSSLKNLNKDILDNLFS